MTNKALFMIWGFYIAVFSIIISSNASCGGDPNAMISRCGVNCRKSCSNSDKNLAMCQWSCALNGCNCKDGYVFDDNVQKCVRPEKCTPVCGQNEEYTSCVEGGCVGARNCSEVSSGQTVPVTCKELDPAACTAGCVCREGFLRNDNEICVAKDECPLNDKCSQKQSEFWDLCPPVCISEACAEIGVPNDCNPRETACKPACRCAQGYYRNSRGTCVPEKQCNQCGKNEVYDKCVTSCPQRTCGVNDTAVLCPPTNPADCKGGCRCADGFYRNKKGECVAWEDCPKCPEHEVFDPCKKSCPPEECLIVYEDTIIHLDDIICRVETNPVCNPGCRCEDGYKRNHRGVCIPKDQCPPCNGDPYAQPGCGHNCGRICPNHDKNPVNCSTAVCQPNGCDCLEGYVYDKGLKKCVLPEKCSPVCGPDEYLDKCFGDCTGSESCEAIVRFKGHTICSYLLECHAGCVCKKGLVYNYDGVCIPKEQCPETCNGDPNAEPGCGRNCGRLCSNYNKGPVTCTEVCHLDGCECKDGYVFDENKKKCVLPEKCSSVWPK